MKLTGTLLLATLASAQEQDSLETYGQNPALRAHNTPSLPAPEKVTMLRLKSGQILWGEVSEHTPDGITFARLDSGGLATLRWSFLDPAQEEELRLKYGYVDLAGEELMVDADRLVLIEGTEIIGNIIDRTATDMILKTAVSPTVKVPLTRIAAASSTVQVPASEIYTKTELYTNELVLVDPESAEQNFELGKHCERILDFAHAVQHYELVQALDPTFKTAELDGALVRARESAALQEQVDFLAKIDLLKRRKKFDEALAMVAEFPELYPSSPLQTKLIKRRDQVLKARDRLMISTIESRWHFTAGRLARRAATSMPYSEAVAYAGEVMSEEVLIGVTEHVQKWAQEIQPEDVRKYWTEREPRRWRTISYGQGTWLLGEGAALKGFEKTDDKPKEEAPLTEQGKLRKNLEEKLNQFMKNRERRQRARSNGDETEDRDFWWAEASLDDRARWILAYYIENGADMALNDKVLFRNCRGCGGTGAKEIVYTGSARSGAENRGESELVLCKVCHGISKVRRIQYR